MTTRNLTPMQKLFLTKKARNSKIKIKRFAVTDGIVEYHRGAANNMSRPSGQSFFRGLPSFFEEEWYEHL